MTTPRKGTMASKGRRRSGGLLGKLSERFSDPRKAGGSIDPQTRKVDSERAVLLQGVGVAEIGMEGVGDQGGIVVFGIELRGVLNTSDGEKANLLVLGSPDATALLVAQIIGLARRGRLGPEFDHALAGRMEEVIGGP